MEKDKLNLDVDKKAKKLDEVFTQVHDYLKKYEVEAKRQRGEAPYLSTTMYTVNSIEALVINGERFNSYNNHVENKTIVTAHYKPAKPIFYVENDFFSKDMVWMAELQAWENYGSCKHSRFEKEEYYLLQPDKINRDKVKMNSFTENDIIEVASILNSFSKEAKEKVDKVTYNLIIKNIKSSFVDVFGSEIFFKLLACSFHLYKKSTAISNKTLSALLYYWCE